MFIRKIEASIALRPKFRSKAAIFSSRFLQLLILIYWAIILFIAITNLHALIVEFAPKTNSGIENIELITWRQVFWNLGFVPIAQLMPFAIFYLKSHPSTNFVLYYDMSHESYLAWMTKSTEELRRIDDGIAKIDDEIAKMDDGTDDPEASIRLMEEWDLLDGEELHEHLSIFMDNDGNSPGDEVLNNNWEYLQLEDYLGLYLHTIKARRLEIFPSFVKNLRESETLFCYLTVFAIDVTVLATLLLWEKIHLLKGGSNWPGAEITEFLVTANVIFLLLALLVLFFNARKSQPLFTSRNRES
jgi:hypothetical protein